MFVKPNRAVRNNDYSLKSSQAPDSTLHAPDTDDTLKKVSTILHRHILVPVRGSGTDKNKQELFNIENFVKGNWKVEMPLLPRPTHVAVFAQTKPKREFQPPSVDTIYRFMSTIFEKAQLSSECSIISLIYIERLMDIANVNLDPKNWRCIVLAALLIASKVWDDLSTWNVEFSEICPLFSLQNINALERHFVNGIKYNLFISGSIYAKYYFALRSLKKHKDSREIPKYYLHLNIGGSRRIEMRTAAATDIRTEDSAEQLDETEARDTFDPDGLSKLKKPTDATGAGQADTESDGAADGAISGTTPDLVMAVGLRAAPQPNGCVPVSV